MFGIEDFSKAIVDFQNFEVSQLGDALLFGGAILLIGMAAIFAVVKKYLEFSVLESHGFVRAVVHAFAALAALIPVPVKTSFLSVKQLAHSIGHSPHGKIF